MLPLGWENIFNYELEISQVSYYFFGIIVEIMLLVLILSHCFSLTLNVFKCIS